MENLDQIGDESQVVDLQQTKEILLAEIKHGEERLARLTVSEESVLYIEGKLKELKATLNSDTKSTANAIRANKAKTKTAKEDFERQDNKCKEIAVTLAKAETTQEKQLASIKQNDARFISNTKEFKEKFSKEREQKTSELDAIIEEKKLSIEVLEKSCIAAGKILSSNDSDNKQLTKENKDLELEIQKNKTRIKTASKKLQEMESLISKTGAIRAQYEELEKKLDRFTKTIKKEEEELVVIKKDQEASRGWMSEKEERIKKVVSTLAKKTNDASILRILDKI